MLWCGHAEFELSLKTARKNSENILFLRNYLETELLKIEGTAVNGSIKSRLLNTTNILFRGVDSNEIIFGLCHTENDLPMTTRMPDS